MEDNLRGYRGNTCTPPPSTQGVYGGTTGDSDGNGNGNGNENVKAIGLLSKNINSAPSSLFLVRFFTIPARLRIKIFQFHVLWTTSTHDNDFFCLYKLGTGP